MFGFFARGSDGHLIIGDDYPVLSQAYRGSITVNSRASKRWSWQPNPSYGYCEVQYPQPIRSQVPPLVFGVPTPACDNKGLGFFQHRGNSGNWTGFSILITPRLFADSSAVAGIGFDSGWEYSVCVFGDPGVSRPGSSNYGLALFDADGNSVFNSNWPFVPFRGLLAGWVLNSYTRSYALQSYWGNDWYERSKRYDFVLAKGTHTWGARDGNLGFLISSLGCVPVRADSGYKNRYPVRDCVVTMGFPDNRRDQLWSVTYYGGAQHPSANINAINSWKILTADFSHL